MDLIEVREVVRPRRESEIPPWRTGDSYVAGGTWLFSEPQPAVRRIIDLTGLPWEPVVGGIGPDGRIEPLHIAGTCTYRTLERLRPTDGGTGGSLGTLAPLVAAAIRSLSSSFKTYEVATVGGNLCLAYAKSMMAPVMVAAGASYVLVAPRGDGAADAHASDAAPGTSGGGAARSDGSARAPAAGSRAVRAEEFQTGVCETIREVGEYLREVIVPVEALGDAWALERLSYTAMSHATALVIVRWPVGGGDRPARMVVSAATAFPVAVECAPESDRLAVARAVREALDRAPALDDAHGSAAYRREVLPTLAWTAWERARAEAAGRGGARGGRA